MIMKYIKVLSAMAYRIIPRKSPDMSVMTVIAISAKKLVYRVTSSLLDPNRNNFSCALGSTASATTERLTYRMPIGLKDGVSFQSAAANIINPAHIATPHTYSVDENVRLFIMVAITMVGINLQDRKTTLVGKLM